MRKKNGWSQEELACGVEGLVEKEKLGYEAAHSRNLVLEIMLCILSAVPIMVLAVSDKNGMLTIVGVFYGAVIGISSVIRKH